MPLRLQLIALLLIGFAGAALAQEPFETKVGLEHSLFLTHERDAVPDTTSPWRYYPIAVGNRWEFYYTWDGFRSVEEILHDTIVAGTHYYQYRSEVRLPAGAIRSSYEVPIRFDTTSALVMMRPDADGPEEPFDRFALYFNCPFDMAFGSTCVSAEEFEKWHVTGGYDVPVIIGGGPTGSQPDTVITSFKRYTSLGLDVQVLDFAAGIGFTQWYSDEGGGRQILHYARVDGVEYGESQFPVTSEPAPEIDSGLAAQLEVWPNPASTEVTIRITSPRSEEVSVSIVDLLGRVVEKRSYLIPSHSPYVVQLDVSGLASGLYLIVARAASVIIHRLTVMR